MKKILIILPIFIFCLLSFLNISFAFGPSSTTIYNGIDISQWQQNIDFTKIKEDGIEIVYIKASQGNDYIDPYFERNYKNAKDNNLKIGVYHFLTAKTIEEAREEADFFASVISSKEIDCRIAMDFEIFGRLSNDEINEISKEFLKRVEEKTKKEMVIYSDSSNAKNIFDQELADKYPIWVAEYDVSEPFNNGKWDSWVGFQYADDGRINGINTYVDKDYFTDDILLSSTSKLPENSHPNNKDTISTITVKRGYTISKLAIEYKTTIEEIVELNNIRNKNLIYIGETLKIPYSTQKEKGETNHIIYTIKRGDTLSKIAREYDTTVNELIRLNRNEIRNRDLIYAGETIRIETK